MAASAHACEHRIIVHVGVARGADTVGPPVVRREPGVVERRTRPHRCRVARLARGREPCRGMHWVRRGIVVCLVAAHTGHRLR